MSHDERDHSLSCSAMSTEVRFKHRFTLLHPDLRNRQVDLLRTLSTESQLLCTECKFERARLLCFSERTFIPTRELYVLNVLYYEGVPVEFKKHVASRVYLY